MTRILVESIETEAELIRLSLDGGWPWERVRMEVRNYRIPSWGRATHFVSDGFPSEEKRGRA